MSISAKDRKEYEEWLASGGSVKNSTPAVLFYQEDFLTGIAEMTMEERGEYITLLSYQNVHGRMSREYIDRVCPGCSEYVLGKFQVDQDGQYYNERMEIEIMRRNKFQESKVENGKKGGRPKAKENLNETDRLSESKPNENLLETETETETENNKSRGRFLPPTVDEVREYATEHSYGVDADAFVAFYESKGWMVGKNKMKDWRAALRGWNSRNKASVPERNEVLGMIEKGVFG